MLEPNEIRVLIPFFKEYIDLIDDVIPLLQEAGNKVLPVIEDLIDASVDLKARAYYRFIEEHGMTEAVALAMTLSLDSSLKSSIKGLKK